MKLALKEDSTIIRQTTNMSHLKLTMLLQQTYLGDWYESVRQDENWMRFREKCDSQQFKMYVKWLNLQFSRYLYDKTGTSFEEAKHLYCSLRVTNLQHDLEDGLRFLYLVDILYNVSLSKEFGPKKTGCMRLHKIRNHDTCLQYLKSEANLKCVGINALDLANGNMKMITGLLFLLKSDFDARVLNDKTGFIQDSQLKLSILRNSLVKSDQQDLQLMSKSHSHIVTDTSHVKNTSVKYNQRIQRLSCDQMIFQQRKSGVRKTVQGKLNRCRKTSESKSSMNSNLGSFTFGALNIPAVNQLKNTENKQELDYSEQKILRAESIKVLNSSETNEKVTVPNYPNLNEIKHEYTQEMDENEASIVSPYQASLEINSEDLTKSTSEFSTDSRELENHEIFENTDKDKELNDQIVDVVKELFPQANLTSKAELTCESMDSGANSSAEQVDVFDDERIQSNPKLHLGNTIVNSKKDKVEVEINKIEVSFKDVERILVQNVDVMKQMTNEIIQNSADNNKCVDCSSDFIRNIDEKKHNENSIRKSTNTKKIDIFETDLNNNLLKQNADCDFKRLEEIPIGKITQENNLEEIKVIDDTLWNNKNVKIAKYDIKTKNTVEVLNDKEEFGEEVIQEDIKTDKNKKKKNKKKGKKLQSSLQETSIKINDSFQENEIKRSEKTDELPIEPSQEDVTLELSKSYQDIEEVSSQVESNVNKRSLDESVVEETSSRVESEPIDLESLEPSQKDVSLEASVVEDTSIQVEPEPIDFESLEPSQEDVSLELSVVEDTTIQVETEPIDLLYSSVEVEPSETSQLINETSFQVEPAQDVPKDKKNDILNEIDDNENYFIEKEVINDSLVNDYDYFRTVNEVKTYVTSSNDDKLITNDFQTVKLHEDIKLGVSVSEVISPKIVEPSVSEIITEENSLVTVIEIESSNKHDIPSSESNVNNVSNGKDCLAPNDNISVDPEEVSLPKMIIEDKVKMNNSSLNGDESITDKLVTKEFQLDKLQIDIKPDKNQKKKNKKKSKASIVLEDSQIKPVKNSESFQSETISEEKSLVEANQECLPEIVTNSENLYRLDESSSRSTENRLSKEEIKSDMTSIVINNDVQIFKKEIIGKDSQITIPKKEVKKNIVLEETIIDRAEPELFKSEKTIEINQLNKTSIVEDLPEKTKTNGRRNKKKRTNKPSYLLSESELLAEASKNVCLPGESIEAQEKSVNCTDDSIASLKASCQELPKSVEPVDLQISSYMIDVDHSILEEHLKNQPIYVPNEIDLELSKDGISFSTDNQSTSDSNSTSSFKNPKKQSKKYAIEPKSRIEMAEESTQVDLSGEEILQEEPDNLQTKYVPDQCVNSSRTKNNTGSNLKNGYPNEHVLEKKVNASKKKAQFNVKHRSNSIDRKTSLFTAKSYKRQNFLVITASVLFFLTMGIFVAVLQKN